MRRHYGISDLMRNPRMASCLGFECRCICTNSWYRILDTGGICLGGFRTAAGITIERVGEIWPG